jgi:hypothetical protein
MPQWKVRKVTLKFLQFAKKVLGKIYKLELILIMGDLNERAGGNKIGKCVIKHGDTYVAAMEKINRFCSL